MAGIQWHNTTSKEQLHNITKIIVKSYSSVLLLSQY